MKPKIKPAAKIFLALCVVGLLFGAKWFFYDKNQPKETPVAINLNTVDTSHANVVSTPASTQSVVMQSTTVQVEL